MGAVDRAAEWWVRVSAHRTPLVFYPAIVFLSGVAIVDQMDVHFHCGEVRLV